MSRFDTAFVALEEAQRTLVSADYRRKEAMAKAIQIQGSSDLDLIRGLHEEAKSASVAQTKARIHLENCKLELKLAWEERVAP